LYTKGKPIDINDVEELVMCSGERQVWGLMDLIGQGKEDEALKFIRRLMRQGESTQGLWHIFLWMMSSLVPVSSAVESGVTNPGAIAKQYGVSYGSARALLPIARKFSNRIKEICPRLPAVLAALVLWLCILLFLDQYQTQLPDLQYLLSLLC